MEGEKSENGWRRKEGERGIPLCDQFTEAAKNVKMTHQSKSVIYYHL